MRDVSTAFIQAQKHVRTAHRGTRTHRGEPLQLDEVQTVGDGGREGGVQQHGYLRGTGGLGLSGRGCLRGGGGLRGGLGFGDLRAGRGEVCASRSETHTGTNKRIDIPTTSAVL